MDRPPQRAQGAPPMPWRHLAALAAFAAAAVALRGVRWDENYEFAQVLIGQIAYPADHPLPRYVSSFATLQLWALAGLMQLAPGPLAANALRNVLGLCATLVPAFLLAHAACGRARWGYAAAALMLLGPHTAFYGNYPVQVWPGLYSNGHIGGAWMLIGLWAFATGRMRAGFVMAGLAPAVHAGQALPLLSLAAWHAIAALRAQDGGRIAAALAWGGGAAALSALFFVLVRSNALPDPAGGPYFDPIDPAAVASGYLAYHDAHRMLLPGAGHIALAGALLLLWHAARAPDSRAARHALGYLTVAAALVYATMALHAALDAQTPRALLAYMPYRLVNHAAPIALPIALGLLAARGRAPAALGALAIGIAAAATRLWPAPHAWLDRYAIDGSAAAYVAAGAALMAVAMPGAPRKLRDSPFAAAACAAAWLALAWVHQFGAACAAAGAAVAMLRGRPLRGAAYAPAATTALLTGLLLAAQWRGRTHLSASPFEREAAAYLAAHNPPGAPVLVRHQQEGLQARLHQPVMTDMASPTWIPYRPSLGPTLDALYRDCYGIDFAQPPAGPQWFEVWAARPRAAWQALAARYGFRFVYAPGFLDLDLDAVLRGPDATLYAVGP